MIDRQVKAGGVIALHRGVYAVGHQALTWRGRATAALLAAGPSSVISHRSAAAAWRILPDASGPIHVTVVGGDRRSRRGLAVHRTPALDGRDVRPIEGVPVTAPARTLVDLAAVGEMRLDAAIAEAQVLRLVRRRDLEAALERASDPRGIPRLRRALAAVADAPTRSELERSMLRLVADAGLPRPSVNRRLGRYTVDFLWDRERVVVETDGWAAHGHRQAFERDRARDADLQARGYVVVRFTWRQINEARLLVATRLAQVLAGRWG
jgi:very-short-patch-repair endonuclease